MGSIAVTNLGKAYKKYPSRRARLADWLLPLEQPRYELHWVLKDINFVINPGEAVGIIGMNGAGKSTLLKMITGTTQPTCGSVHIQGRMAALLELGMGFHPDFTGRQNAFMAGQLLGLNTEEITALMPEIEAFAEIGEYIDQPVRVYSSGMQVRLAFAVATAKRPDILIVDEALAVGDIFFQQKCFDRIRSFISEKTTLLFVSHSPDLVYSLCSRALLIEGGLIISDSKPKEVIDIYNAKIATRNNHASTQTILVVPHDDQTASTEANIISTESQVECIDQTRTDAASGCYFSKNVDIKKVEIYHNGNAVACVLCGQMVSIKVETLFNESLSDPHIGFQIRNQRGEPIYMTTTHGLGRHIGAVKTGSIVSVLFSLNVLLIDGDYTITAGVANGVAPTGDFIESLARLQGACAFSVIRPIGGNKWAGMFDLSAQCEIHIS